MAPADLALGQVVPFEVEITVSGDTTPEDSVTSFTGGWNTKTSNGEDFGYDPKYMVYSAFVDTSDNGTRDNGKLAKVDSFTSTLTGSGAKEEIKGTFAVSGLDDGDNIIVEIWVVLKPRIPLDLTGNGNVGSELISAQTVTSKPDKISGTGNQNVPLLNVKEFITSNADVSVTKTDSPDPVDPGAATYI